MSCSASPPLPVHGFILAGGKSLRMGRDKALLEIQGRPMVETAVEKLSSFCANVCIAGNRDDLGRFAPVVRESRLRAGPVAGIEAGLRASASPWALFVPVDVPLVPASLLVNWARAVLTEDKGVRLSFLCLGGKPQPAFCLLDRTCADAIAAAVDHGALKLLTVFEQVASLGGHGALWAANAESFVPQPGDCDGLSVETCFANVNTPDDLAALAAWSETHAGINRPGRM